MPVLLMQVAEFLATFCKFSVYGNGTTIQINEDYYLLTNDHISQCTPSKVDFIIRYEGHLKRVDWDTILNKLRSGDILVYNAKSEKFRSRTIINKWLLQFI